MEGALSEQADRVQRELEATGREQLVIPTLMRLVTLNVDDEPVRKRITERLGDGESAVVQAFEQARLLIRGEGVVEVAHEALLSSWPPLKTAIARDLTRLRIRADLTRDAERWEKEGRPPDAYLQRDLALTRTRQLLDASEGVKVETLSALERAFLDASKALDARQHARRRRLWRIAWAAVIIFVVGLLVATAFSINRSNEAEQQRKRADQQRQLADAGRTEA